MWQEKVSISVNIKRFSLSLQVKRDVRGNEQQTDSIRHQLKTQLRVLQESH